MFDFTGKTVLITGGASGIGREIAKAFLGAGASVIVAGLPTPEPALEQVRTEHLDISDASGVAKFMAAVPELHVVVNAAGMIRRDDEYNLDAFEQVIDVNLTGTMRVCMAARPKLLATHGCIVNFASMYSMFGGPRCPAYSASKGAIAQLTRSLGVAWALDGIRVNAVAPGWIATTLTQALRDDEARSAPIMARSPFRRWGRPEEIAAPVLFLCSDAASFITAAIIPVDGGYSAA
jgi:NAD(P)-dependent dehydrogenase (short-subunit alcohol dehydrogenase family)